MGLDLRYNGYDERWIVLLLALKLRLYIRNFADEFSNDPNFNFIPFKVDR
jgi:hypothetical protein